MSVTLVQTKTAHGNLVASVSVTPTVVAGDLLIAICANGFSGPGLGTPAITDSAGNVWTQSINSASFGDNTDILLYWAIANASGPTTVTLTAVNNAGNIGLIFAEYSGIINPPLDQAHSGFGGPNTGNITTTANGDLIIAVSIDGGNNGTVPGSGSPAWGVSAGFTIQATVTDLGGGGSEPVSAVYADQIQPLAGLINAVFVDTTGNSINSGIAGFFAVLGPPPGVGSKLLTPPAPFPRRLPWPTGKPRLTEGKHFFMR